MAKELPNHFVITKALIWFFLGGILLWGWVTPRVFERCTERERKQRWCLLDSTEVILRESYIKSRRPDVVDVIWKISRKPRVFIFMDSADST